ncbi:ABC transporter permease [Sediminicoccus rosea]|uniref:ABC transporter permease n=1 Tax=Sediminicoccus rosea TaxID=1225128 RepID=A0ABZ0PMR5_9PROT|nr:ABC transporter permease [Sediminicoccus rosea]WPB86756.1 ABC transporter permease [Sediminicoccus rosea]
MRALDLLARLMARAAVLAAVLFLLVPLLVACLLSFDDRSFLGAFPPREFSLRWYRAFATNPTYMDGLFVSLQLGLVAAAIATILGTMGALALMDPRLAGRDTLEAVFLSPKFIPTVVIGFSLLVFTAKLGIFDPFTRLVMGHVVITLPFTLRAVLASLIGVKRSQIEAAISLGASEARALWDVAVPAARSGIVAGAAMAFVLSFDEVAVSLFLSDAFTQTLPIALVAEMRANLNLTIAAVSTVFLAATLVLLLLLDRTIGIERLAGDVGARG